MPRLYVLSGDDLGRTYEIHSDSAVLGRVKGVDCVVRGASISRQHARLEREEEGWVLVDLDSRNGIAKGGVRRERIPLEDGDVVLLGDIEVRFRDEAAAKPDEPAPVQAQPAALEAELELDLGDEPTAEMELGIELEGDWSEEAAPLPSEPMIAAAARPEPEPEAEAGAEAPAKRRRSAEAQATIDAIASQRSGAQATTSGRAILQYNRVERRGGLFSSDLGQQPLGVRLLLAALLLALGAGVVYGFFQLTRSLRTPTAIEGLE